MQTDAANQCNSQAQLAKGTPMQKTETAPLYRVWGADKIVYGPLDLPTLVQWVQGRRLAAQTWVLSEATDQWQRAAELPELKPHFAVKAAAAAPASPGPGAALDPEALRRTKLFAGLDAPQLASLAHYLEVIRFPQFSHIVRQGQRGDAMYVVAQGEVRVLTIVEGKESLLATLSAGDCFGEISLLDQGPRSADIIANKDSVLLRISKAAFDRLVCQAPALAVPFLLALSRAVVQRVRRTNLKYQDSIRFIRASTTRH
jgi:hypothetical protein